MGTTGIEPASPGLKVRCIPSLPHARKKYAEGVEPSHAVLQTAAAAGPYVHMKNGSFGT